MSVLLPAVLPGLLSAHTWRGPPTWCALWSPTRVQDAPWFNKILWDTSGCCNMYTNDFWSLVRALFGYTGACACGAELVLSWRRNSLPCPTRHLPMSHTGASDRFCCLYRRLQTSPPRSTCSTTCCTGWL